MNNKLEHSDIFYFAFVTFIGLIVYTAVNGVAVSETYNVQYYTPIIVWLITLPIHNILVILQPALLVAKPRTDIPRPCPNDPTAMELYPIQTYTPMAQLFLLLALHIGLVSGVYFVKPTDLIHLGLITWYLSCLLGLFYLGDRTPGRY